MLKMSLQDQELVKMAIDEADDSTAPLLVVTPATLELQSWQYDPRVQCSSAITILNPSEKRSVAVRVTQASYDSENTPRLLISPSVGVLPPLTKMQVGLEAASAEKPSLAQILVQAIPAEMQDVSGAFDGPEAEEVAVTVSVEQIHSGKASVSGPLQLLLTRNFASNVAVHVQRIMDECTFLTEHNLNHDSFDASGQEHQTPKDTAANINVPVSDADKKVCLNFGSKSSIGQESENDITRIPTKRIEEMPLTVSLSNESCGSKAGRFLFFLKCVTVFFSGLSSALAINILQNAKLV